MRGSKSKAQQYGGERTLLYKKEAYSILNSLVNFAVYLDPRMLMKFPKNLKLARERESSDQ